MNARPEAAAPLSPASPASHGARVALAALATLVAAAALGCAPVIAGAACGDDDPCPQGTSCVLGVCESDAVPFDGGAAIIDGGAASLADGGGADGGGTGGDAGGSDDDGGGGDEGGTASDGGDVGGDGGAGDDGGAPDDGGALDDGGGDPLDGGAPVDGGAVVDGGMSPDAGAQLDAGSPVDGGCPAPPLTGLVAWYSAKRGPLLVGPAQTCWPDQSGGGHHACQANGPAAPTMSDYDGEPVLDFVADDSQHLVVPDADALDAPQMTILVAGSIEPGGDDWGGIVTKTTDGDWTDGWGLARDFNNSALLGFAGDFALDGRVGDINLAQPFLAVLRADANVLLRVEGATSDLSSSTRQVAYAPTVAPLRIGAGVDGTAPGTTSYFHDGKLAEVLIYDRALSDLEIASLGTQLLDCYGVD